MSPTTCPWCGRPAVKTGLCAAHYFRKRNGSPPMDAPVQEQLRGPDLYDRVMSRTERRGACLEYTGHRFANGYGGVSHKERWHRAHRIVWEHHNGPVPEGLVVRHTCDNPPCVEISHLLVGTVSENSIDMVSRDRSHLRKLTDEQVLAIRADRRRYREIADEYAISVATVKDIRYRRTYRWLSERLQPVDRGC